MLSFRGTLMTEMITAKPFVIILINMFIFSHFTNETFTLYYFSVGFGDELVQIVVCSGKCG